MTHRVQKTSVSWPPELVERVKAAAKADGRSVSQFTARLLDKVLDELGWWPNQVGTIPDSETKGEETRR